MGQSLNARREKAIREALRGNEAWVAGTREQREFHVNYLLELATLCGVEGMPLNDAAVVEALLLTTATSGFGSETPENVAAVYHKQVLRERAQRSQDQQ